MRLFFRALGDFFSAKFLAFSLLPLAAGLAFAGALSYGIYALFAHIASELAASTGAEQAEQLGALAAAVAHYALIFSGAAGAIFSLFYGWQISIIFALCIISLLTANIVGAVNSRHYGRQIARPVGFWRALLAQARAAALGVFWLLCAALISILPGFAALSPLLFTAAFFNLYFRLLVLDVASCALEAEEFARFRPLQPRYLLCCACYYAASHLPFVGFFAQVFFLIHFAHVFLSTLPPQSPALQALERRLEEFAE